MTENSDPEVNCAGRPVRLIRIKEVQHRTGLGRSTIYRWMAEGRFPKPVKLGGHSVAWREDILQTWIHAKGK